MRLRFILICCVLAIIGTFLLYASYALAAAPSPVAPVPGWMWGGVGGVVLGLLGVCGWWVRRWIERREKWEDMILLEVRALGSSIHQMRGFQGVIIERIDSLPCREDRGRGNGIPSPPSTLCSLRDKDAP